MERIRRLFAIIALFYASMPGSADLLKPDDHVHLKELKYNSIVNKKVNK